MTVHTRDAEVTNHEWCDQELANKKSDGIHLIITQRERCNTLLGLFFWVGGGERRISYFPTTQNHVARLKATQRTD